jgi:thiamine-phosphate pyrophosphorylase
LPELAAEAAAAGIDWFQVREKDLPGRVLLELVGAVMDTVAGRCGVLVSSRPDVAEAAGCAGVQLPEAGLPVGEVRRSFPRLRVGASCHSLEAARRAAGEGADFVLLGPVFATAGKEHRALGATELARLVAALDVPVHAIGGIDARTAPQAVAAGARGLAAIGAFHRGAVADAVRRLRLGVGA